MREEQPALLRVEDLTVSFPDPTGSVVTPVRGVSFEIGPREILGLVGESGSGKSLTARSCLRLIREPGVLSATSLSFDGIDLLGAPESVVRSLRGQKMALVAQDPLSSLHPSIRVGTQMEHALKDHGAPRERRRERVVAMLQDVGLPDPARQARRYPHELSGGMRQRAMIAIALINNPTLVIADEPTTALDATVQSQILQLLATLSQERHLSVLLLTHNLGIVAGICNRVLVMYAGRIVEAGPTSELFTNPQHPYTKALLEAVPRLELASGQIRGIPGSPPSPWDRPSGCAFHPRCRFRIDRCSRDDPTLALTPSGRLAACWVSQEAGGLPALARASSERLAASAEPATSATEPDKSSPIFVAENLTRHFPAGGRWRHRELVHALDAVDLHVYPGESLGIVGESGSGKTTLTRLLALLDRPTRGSVTFRGSDVAHLTKDKLREFRRSVQIIFQDPYASLDPRYTVAQSISEALRLHRLCDRAEEGTRVLQLLERVGLSSRMAGRYPREMSGGERQRVSIARALAVQPEVLLADEPVSALDVSIQAQIIELLEELKLEENLTLVLVAHDLGLIREVCDRVVTVYLGKLVEDAPTNAFFERRLHPYSYALFRAAPDPSRIGSLPASLAAGDPPSPVHPPAGCRFHTRCFNAQPICAQEEPPLEYVEPQRRIACFYPVTDEQHASLDSAETAAVSVVSPV